MESFGENPAGLAANELANPGQNLGPSRGVQRRILDVADQTGQRLFAAPVVASAQLKRWAKLAIPIEPNAIMLWQLFKRSLLSDPLAQSVLRTA